MNATPAAATAPTRFSRAHVINWLLCVAALARIPSLSSRALQGNMLNTGNTVSMIHSAPTQIADFLAELIPLS